MHNQWTFTETDSIELVHETFYSKIDAKAEGKKMFKGKDIIIGQLKDCGNSYAVENQEVIKVN
ncbi:hypothetical protein QH639_19220 [Lysinibacillus sp. 1 U-2021]|uniref:hypothetical protein n=1 Tax=Lysinibacillus sp. 1 U-2021 TaxID=3039426 RepID=UPI002480C6EE|nr:hypothetical protein [Lysinibacillus sp. 1 U-2021]WGT37934.1 hypothetical protein QH639_19220 [Lysinibacillus sp. 1 U-2021]